MNNTIINTRVCGYCNKQQTWQWLGQKLKDGSKIYVNDHGQRWAGKRCPTCEKNRVTSAVRHDQFDRDMIFKQLEDRGFTIVSRTHPIRAAKAGQEFQIGIRRARMKGETIVVESSADTQDDIVALVFESVRLVTPEQMQGMTVYESESASKHNVPSDFSHNGMVAHEVNPA